MGNLGGPEILVILFVALMVLGPKKLPEAARQVGKAVAEVRKVSSGFQREMRDAMREPIEQIQKIETAAKNPRNELRKLAQPAELTAQEAADAPVAAPSAAAEASEPDPAPDTGADPSPVDNDDTSA